jgi:hypothetical protein
MATIWVAALSGGTTVWTSNGSAYAGQPALVTGDTISITSGAVASGLNASGTALAVAYVVSSGGTLESTLVSSGTVKDYGFASGNTLTSVNETVYSGGILSGETGNTDTLTISAGGYANALIENNKSGNGGAGAVNLYGSAGSIAVTSERLTVYSGASLASGFNSGDWGDLHISNGGTVSAETLTGAAELTNYGVLSTLTVSNLSSSGVDSGIVIELGGTTNNIVFDSGNYTSIPVVLAGSVGNVTVNSGASISSSSISRTTSLTVNSGGAITVSSGVVSNATINAGGTLRTSATIDSAALSGGALILSGSGYASVTADSGGTITVSGGTAAIANSTAQPGDVFGVVSGGILAIAGATPGTTLLAGDGLSGIGGSAGGGFELSGVPYSTSDIITATQSGQLTIIASGSTYYINAPGILSGASITPVNLGGNLGVTCFLEGTRIATPSGGIAVEDLHEDDLVLTASGEAKPVRWIGYRNVTLAEMAEPALCVPVRIEKDAIAQGKPARDLWVTPDHAIFVAGRLIPAKLLVNGASIREEPREHYSYYHLELGRHDLLLAEGLEAESYLDIEASRQRFANHSVTNLHETWSLTEDAIAAYRERGCYPLCLDAAEVREVWQAVAGRAWQRNQVSAPAAVTRDPGLHLLADGKVVPPSGVEDGRYRFTLPPPGKAARVVIASRTASPWTQEPWRVDRRQLGVAIAAISLCDEGGAAPLSLAALDGQPGWYPLEQDRAAERIWRWTDGAALLPLLPYREGAWLEIHVHATLGYAAAPAAVALPDLRRALQGLTG